LVGSTGSRPRRRAARPPRLAGAYLQPRKRQVLELWVAGYTVVEITELLDVGGPTVYQHIVTCLRKARFLVYGPIDTIPFAAQRP
jgi:DNA-binding CsgD family transcriptional regulator